MKHRILVGVFALAALAACDDIDIPQTDVPVQARQTAIAEIPAKENPFDHFRMEHIEGDHGPGYAEEGVVNFYVQDHLIYSTSDGCHIPADGIRECGWDGPRAITADEVVAFALPEATSFGIVRDGQVQVEVPVPFAIRSLRYDGELIWVMPAKPISGNDAPLLFNKNGELVRTPHYWEAR